MWSCVAGTENFLSRRVEDVTKNYRISIRKKPHRFLSAIEDTSISVLRPILFLIYVNDLRIIRDKSTGERKRGKGGRGGSNLKFVFGHRFIYIEYFNLLIFTFV